MPLIAVTGGIGAGKSEFTRCLTAITGALTIDTDQCARDLLEGDEETGRDIRAEFGEEVFDPSNGQIDRAALRSTVFNREDRRRALEAILHPRIRARWTDWAKEKSPGAILLVEIPLLYETNAVELFDFVVAVGCSRRTQLLRLTAGRQLSLQMAERIIATQWPIEDKVHRCDCVVWNDGSRAALQAQIVFCAARISHASNLYKLS